MGKNKKEAEGMSLSRRDFLKNAGLLAGSAAIGSTFLAGFSPEQAAAAPPEYGWDYEADVVVIGAGGAGLPAALKAQAEGASVLVVEANWDTGGHAAVSGGNLHSGAGTAIQKKYNIADTPDQYYIDHTTYQTLDSRYNDRDVLRSTANHMAEAFEFILANGVLIVDRAPTKSKSYLEGGTTPESVARDTKVDWDTMQWVPKTIAAFPPTTDPQKGLYGIGIGLTRPLEKTAREKGIRFLMNYHMDKVFREEHLTGRVLGIEATYSPTIVPGKSQPLKNLMPEGNIETTKRTVTIKANKGIVIATGGSSSNVKFRTIYDPRLGIEYDGTAGDPFSSQDASGELAALAIGASLGVTANATLDNGWAITHPGVIGCRYGYRNLRVHPTSPVFPLLGATGLACTSYEDVILVNMLGKRIFDESKANDNHAYYTVALGSVVLDEESPTDAKRVGGPIWAIFDQATADRRGWVLEPPYVDIADGRFFSGNTIEELANNIVNKYYESVKIDPAVLADTIKRYNGFVDAKKDEDFGKTTLDAKIEKGPFYAAWATPCPHDCLTGLRVNGNMNVLDIYAEPIPGLYCGGESAAGQHVHGFGKVITQGYIAGKSAALGL